MVIAACKQMKIMKKVPPVSMPYLAHAHKELSQTLSYAADAEASPTRLEQLT